MKDVLIVGAGGIGSFLVKELYDLLMKNQINANIVVYDDDDIEEKNIKYQNFEIENLGKSKVKDLEDRFLINGVEERFTEENKVDEFDMVVSCVDNNQTRKILFNKCEENDVGFIDLRSEGKTVAFFTHNVGKDEYMKSLGENLTNEGSCQLKKDLEQGRIQNGNRIIATIGGQLILNCYRNDYLPKKNMLRF